MGHNVLHLCDVIELCLTPGWCADWQEDAAAAAAAGGDAGGGAAGDGAAGERQAAELAVLRSSIAGDATGHKGRVGQIWLLAPLAIRAFGSEQVGSTLPPSPSLSHAHPPSRASPSPSPTLPPSLSLPLQVGRFFSECGELIRAQAFELVEAVEAMPRGTSLACVGEELARMSEETGAFSDVARRLAVGVRGLR